MQEKDTSKQEQQRQAERNKTRYYPRKMPSLALLIIALLLQALQPAIFAAALTTITNDNIRSAVQLWMSNEQQARSQYGDIEEWDVSRVDSLKRTFYYARAFNGNLNSWDVSRVTSLSYTFYGASSFNGNLNSWDVSRVVTLERTFLGASSFNGNLNSWNVSRVTSLEGTFSGQARLQWQSQFVGREPRDVVGGHVLRHLPSMAISIRGT